MLLFEPKLKRLPDNIEYGEIGLLQRVEKGDESAFRELFISHHNKVANYVLKLIGSYAFTQEIVQDVFLKIWCNRADLAEIRVFDAYLFTLARNHTLNYITKMSREQRNLNQWRQNVSLDEREVESDNHRKEYLHKLLEHAVLSLPPGQQKIYKLHRIEGISHAAIAHQLGISTETVKKQMSRALSSIREYLLQKNNSEIFELAVPLFLLAIVM